MSPEVVLFGLLPPLLYAAALGTSSSTSGASWSRSSACRSGWCVHGRRGGPRRQPPAAGELRGRLRHRRHRRAAGRGRRHCGRPADRPPARTTTILEGESLLNDATALVSLRTAIAAAGLASAHGAAQHTDVSFVSVAEDFGRAVIGGVGVGWLVFLLVGLVQAPDRKRQRTPRCPLPSPSSPMSPRRRSTRPACSPSSPRGCCSRTAPRSSRAPPSRLSERINWASITFLLENAVFLLIGLQMKSIIADVRRPDHPRGAASWSVSRSCSPVSCCGPCGSSPSCG